MFIYIIMLKLYVLYLQQIKTIMQKTNLKYMCIA